MEYFPKNKIKTGLYTSGNEYTLIEDNKNYIGKYWSTSSGKLFTGLGPTDKPYFELSPLKKVIKITKNPPPHLLYQTLYFRRI